MYGRLIPSARNFYKKRGGALRRVISTLRHYLIRVLLESVLTLTIAVLLPVVALATVALLPFSDRLTQVYQMVSYLTLVAVVVLL